MLSLGAVLQDRYRVDNMLEIGALESQYWGWDLEAHQAVIIRELLPQPDLDPTTLRQFQEDFERDAAALAQLRHPHIISVLDYFCEPSPDPDAEALGHAYLITETVPGQTLAYLIERERTLPEKRVVAWAQQILDALIYAHGQGVLHRDIRPENILITPDDRAVLVNFEMVALWDANDPRTWTAKRVMGTPEYAPPERWGMRTTHIDARSDLYSLGATLYHALTGDQPLTAGERTANPYRFLQVKALSPRVSERTKHALLKAMELPSNKRFQSAAEMAKAWAETPRRQESVVPPPAPFLPSLGERERPNIAGLVLSTLIILGAGLFGLWLNRNVAGPWLENRRLQRSVDVTTTPPAEMAVVAEASEDALLGFARRTPDAALTPGPTPRPDEGKAMTIPAATPVDDPAEAAATPSPSPDVFEPFTNGTLAPPDDWTLVVKDAFADNRHQWLQSEYEDDWGSVSRTVVDSAYRWEVNASQAVSRWCTPDNINPDRADRRESVRDFYVSVAAQRLSGPPSAAYGLLLRLTEEGSYYLFNVRDDGYFQFNLWSGVAWEPIIDWTQTTLVSSGEVNHLTVLAREDTFEFYINDEFVAQAEDDQVEEGEIGLSISTAATDGQAVFIFDDYELWSP